MLSIEHGSLPWLSLVTTTWIRSDCAPAGNVPSQIPSTGEGLAEAETLSLEKFSGIGVPWSHVPVSVAPLLSTDPFQLPCTTGTLKLKFCPSRRTSAH